MAAFFSVFGRFIFSSWPLYIRFLALFFSVFGRLIFRFWPCYFQFLALNFQFLAVFCLLNVMGFSGWVGVFSEP